MLAKKDAQIDRLMDCRNLSMEQIAGAIEVCSWADEVFGQERPRETSLAVNGYLHV